MQVCPFVFLLSASLVQTASDFGASLPASGLAAARGAVGGPVEASVAVLVHRRRGVPPQPATASATTTTRLKAEVAARSFDTKERYFMLR